MVVPMTIEIIHDSIDTQDNTVLVPDSQDHSDFVCDLQDHSVQNIPDSQDSSLSTEGSDMQANAKATKLESTVQSLKDELLATKDELTAAKVSLESEKLIVQDLKTKLQSHNLLEQINTLQRTIIQLDLDLKKTDIDYEFCKELLRDNITKQESLIESRNVLANSLDQALSEIEHLKTHQHQGLHSSAVYPANTSNFLLFRAGGPLDILSNFSRGSFSYNNIKYSNVEQAYQ